MSPFTVTHLALRCVILANMFIDERPFCKVWLSSLLVKRGLGPIMRDGGEIQ